MARPVTGKARAANTRARVPPNFPGHAVHRVGERRPLRGPAFAGKRLTRHSIWRTFVNILQRILLSACAAVGFLSTPPASAQTSCSVAPTTGLGSFNGTVAVKPLGYTGRWYSLHVPAGITPGSRVPLLIDLHGAGETEDMAEYQTGWSAYADQQKFIVAYGQANANFWGAYQANSSDVQYLRDVADDIAATYCVDPQRIYIEGFSNGGVMAQRAACDGADKFAAVHSHAGATPTMLGAACTPSRAIGVGMTAGDQDDTQSTPYDEEARDMWVALDGCSTTPTHSSDAYGSNDRYTGCSGGVQVWWRILTGKNHEWPTGAEGEDLHSRIWNFLMSHTLP